MNSLRAALDEYLAMRHALGYKLKDASAALPTFVSFLEKRGKSYVTVRLALEWSMLPTEVSSNSWAARLGFARGFARYRSATDPRTEVPPCGLLPWRNSRAKPHLYTDEQIRGLMDAALRLRPKDGLRPWTFYCIFGLLPVTGLRISEALSLQYQDVDLQGGILTIRRSKFGKSRFVPIHASTKQALREYAERRDRFLCGRTSQSFFVCDRDRQLTPRVVCRAFHKVSRQIGLRTAEQGGGPRLHDFRHHFALKTLVSWYRSGRDVDRCVPILSTYLGHVGVTHTYWYLSLCPELMSLAAARLERRWEG
ncbi:MAG: tyrosine-type recombinase/integrase [Pyrinomonadaceae bacterium]